MTVHQFSPYGKGLSEGKFKFTQFFISYSFSILLMRIMWITEQFDRQSSLIFINDFVGDLIHNLGDG